MEKKVKVEVINNEQGIGNPEEALEAYSFLWDSYSPGDIEDLPEGWKFLGNGPHRYAFLSPSGVVYKVPSGAGIRATKLEAELFEAWTGRSFCPKFGLFLITDEYGDEIPIISMEYLENDGSRPRNFEEMLRALADAQVVDLGDSWVVRKGRAIVRDAGGIF